MLIQWLVGPVFLVAVSTAVAAQTKPDFSGEWVLDRPASTLSPGAGGIDSGVVRIEHREPVFRYNARFVAQGKPIEYAFELTSDGKEVASAPQAPPAVSSLRWDGDALVYTGRLGRAGAEMTLSFRYELVDGGRRLRAVEQIRGAGRDQDNVWLFDRR